MSWNNLDIEYLMKNYAFFSNKELSLVLNKKISTIKEFARRKGLKKKYDYNQNKRMGNLSNLLLEIPEAYYWIGFIFADGNLSLSGRLSVTSSWDYNQLEKLANFINTKVTINKKSKSIKNYSGSREIFYRVSVSDITNYSNIMKKFNINHQKTYFPSDLYFLDNDWKFYSFLIGFIDGDGNISNGSIKIVNHINWNNTHNLIANKLKNLNIKSSVKIDTNGDSLLTISRILYHELKKFIIDNNIPAMDRKWNIN